jgi:hypothetical protein
MIQLANMSDEERATLGGHPVIGEGGGGGIPGPPASSFSGSLTNPLQAPPGPPRNLPGEFNGEPYSGHAFDALQNRGIPPSAADQAIQRGIQTPGNFPGTTQYYDPINNISVIRNDTTGNVITVFPGR